MPVLDTSTIQKNLTKRRRNLSCTEVQRRHLGGLKAFKEEHPDCRLIIVSMDAAPRLLNEVEILPATDFLKKLWNGEVVDVGLLD